MSQQEVLIRTAPTPNPFAWKFILGRPVLNEGKATFTDPDNCGSHQMASDLLRLNGVTQVHFFSNVITITHVPEVSFEDLRDLVNAIIQRDIAIHDPSITPEDDKKKKREGLSYELRQIEEILDRTVRPGLQHDGGDIEVVKYEHPQLYIYYQGACGNCPSSTEGTLMGIESILRDEFHPEVVVVPVN
jgi:Fe-S cluster biogenesis protein NfuA